MPTDAPKPSPTTYRPRVRSPLWLLLWIVLALVLTAALTGGIFLALQRWFPLRDDDGALFEYARTTAALTAVIGAAVVATIAVRRQVHTERAHQLDRDRYRLDRDKHEDERALRLDERQDRRADTDRAEVLALRERYTTAAAQLGHASSAIRLAGVHAMAALADDWALRGADPEVQTCIDVLCGVIRIPPPAEASPEDWRGEIEVRQTIVRLITAHLKEGAAPGWQGKNFDFTGADFDGEYSFAGSRFTGGVVDFSGARFTSGIVSFSGAEFAGSVVHFSGAQFTGGEVQFPDAQFTGGVVHFSDAHFTGGDVGFFRAKFEGSEVYFRHCQFAGSNVRFISVQFLAGIVWFFRAIFTSGSVTFFDAQFTGGDVDFHEAQQRDGVVSSQWIGDPPPGWPIPLIEERDTQDI